MHALVHGRTALHTCPALRECCTLRGRGAACVRGVRLRLKENVRVVRLHRKVRLGAVACACGACVMHAAHERARVRMGESLGRRTGGALFQITGLKSIVVPTRAAVMLQNKGIAQ